MSVENLIETLAAGAGGKAPEPGFARHREMFGTPDEILVVRTDDGDAAFHARRSAGAINWRRKPAPRRFPRTPAGRR